MSYSSQLLKTAKIQANTQTQLKGGLSNSSFLLSASKKPDYKPTPYVNPYEGQQTQPVETKKQTYNFFESLSKNINWLKESFVVGGKNLSGTLKATGSVLVQGLADAFDAKDLIGDADKRTLESLKKKTPNSLSVKLLEDTINTREKIKKSAKTKLSETAAKLRDSAIVSTKDALVYAQEKIPVENPKNFREAISDPGWIARQVVQNTPSMLASLGLGVATAVLTKNPAAGAAVGFAGSFAQNAGDVYLDAKEFGLDDKRASNLAVMGGAGMGILDSLPLGRLISRLPEGKVIRNKILKEMTVSLVKQGVLEGGTESLQEIVGNAIGKTYDKNRSLFQGVPESFLIGGIMGGASDVTTNAYSAIAGTAQDTQASNSINAKIEAIKAKPEEQLLPEEKQILDSLNKAGDGSSLFDKVETATQKVLKYDNSAKFSADVFGTTDTSSFGFTKPDEIVLKGKVDGLQVQNYIASLNNREEIEPVIVRVDGDTLVSDTDSYKVTAYKVMGIQMPTLIKEGSYEGLTEIKTLYKDLKDAALAKQEELNKVDPLAFRYEGAKNLSEEEKAIEDNFGKYLKENPDKAMADYVAKFGKVLNTDNVRELSPDYEKNRSLYSRAVHEPASALTKYMYKKMLQAPDPSGEDLVTFTAGGTGAGKTTSINGENVVTFTAGGTGAGKTTAISNVEVLKELYEKSQIIFDTNMNTYDSSVQKIEQALAAGKRVEIMYVYADPIKALKQAINRAKRMGRTVPINEHIKTHKGAYETIYRLQEKYKNNDDVIIDVIDNSGEKNKAVFSTLDKLKGKKYDEVRIEREANEILKSAYQQKEISKDIYEGFTGKKADTIKDIKPNIQERDVGESKQSEGLKPRQFQEVSSSNVPVGEGKKRNSRLQERLQEQLLDIDAGKYEFDETTGKYNTLNLETDAGKALDYINTNPSDALRVAMGLKSAPVGQTANGIGLAVALKAREEGNYKLYVDIVNKVSLRSTRLGQEIVSLRGKFTGDKPENFIKQVLSRRLHEMGKSIVTDAREALGNLKLAREKAVAKIDEQTERINKIVAKERSKIQLAQNIIEALKCK